MTKQELLDRLERIADGMDSDFLNRHDIEGIVADIKDLRFQVETQGIKIEVN